VFISFLAMPLFASDKGLGVSVGMDYMSKNIWRGMPVFVSPFGGIDGAFFPFVSYENEDAGLSVRVEGEVAESYIIDSNKTYKENNAINFNVDYSNKIDMVTIGGGAWYFRVKDNDWSYSTAYVSFALEDIILSPILILNWDYYFSDEYSMGGVKYKREQGKDFYIQLGISHTFDIAADVASLKLGALAGYFNSEVFDVKGISDIDLSAELTVKQGAVTYFAGFHYLIIPKKEFSYASFELDLTKVASDPEGVLVKDRNRFYATFGASYSF